MPGDVCHVDSIVYENQMLFAVASQYGYPPLDVSHRGGIFTTRLLERGSPDAQALLAKNQRVLAAMGLLRGVSHTEFIKGDDGMLYFLETSARVGGAHIAELVEAATGLNLWGEWAKVEIAGGKLPYAPPPPANDYAALLVSLAKQEHPDTSAYDDPEIVWRMQMAAPRGADRQIGAPGARGGVARPICRAGEAGFCHGRSAARQADQLMPYVHAQPGGPHEAIGRAVGRLCCCWSFPSLLTMLTAAIFRSPGSCCRRPKV